MQSIGGGIHKNLESKFIKSTYYFRGSLRIFYSMTRAMAQARPLLAPSLVAYN